MQNLIKPNAPELEGAVLGAIMIEKGAINHVVEIIKDPETFYSESNQHIFRAILKLYNEGEAIDMLTVTEQLIKDKKYKVVGGEVKASYYISQLTIQVNSAAHIQTHSRVLVEKYMKRIAIDNLNAISTDCYNDGDVFKSTDDIQQLAVYLSEIANTGKGYETYKELIAQVIDYLELKRNGGEKGKVIKTGLIEFDKIVGDLERGSIYILAGRPGMGKTAVALSIMNYMGLALGLNVMMYSLEMKSVNLMKRTCASEAEIPSGKMKTGEMTNEEWERLIQVSAQIASANVAIDQEAAMTIRHLRTQVKKYIAKNGGLDVVFIDYLQLMTGNEKNREQEIAAISRGLKQIAIEFDIVMIPLAQLNRSVETRGGDKKPMLSDLRESGQIEQDADAVVLLYRPEYYEITEDEDGNSTFQVIKLIVAKNREGEAGEASCRFIGQYTKVTNWENEADSFNFDEDQDYGSDPLPTSTEF